MVRLSRVSVIHLILALFAVALITQAARVQLVQGKDWAERARRQQYRNGDVAAARGNIFDASGNVLVESREMFRLNVAPGEVKDAPRLTRELRRAGVGQEWIRASTDRKRKWVSLPGLYVAADVATFTSLAGVHFVPLMIREYANTAGIRRIVGNLDPDGRALGGIELALDSVLSGDSLRSPVARDVRGRRLGSPGEWETIPRAGSNVTLTINRDLQEICERALARATDSLNASGGDIVVMNPNNGEVLAMASRRQGVRSLSNTAVTEPFEPGSTLKPFIAAALLDRKRARADEMMNTFGGEMVLDGRRFTDVHKARELTLADVIRYSSNIGIVQFAARLTPREEYETLRDLGLGTATGVPLPGEADGTLREPRRWTNKSAASMVMGYELSVTPLQLVAAYATLANGGELLQPHVIREVRGSDGELIYKARRRVLRRVFSEHAANEVRGFLKSVVDSGTGVKADLATFEMAGKSGTARRAVRGQGYVEGDYTASFVGLFPADKPQYIVLVKLDSPRGAYYGGEIAAPVLAVVLRAALAARDAALNREDLASVEREVQLPSSADSPAAGKASPQRPAASVEDAAAEPDTPAVFGVDPAPYSEKTPQPARVISLPFVPARVPEDRSPRAVPDVRGLPTRSAVRALHASGFRVTLVSSQDAPTIPAPGTVLPAGAIVKLQHNP
ncbi:MAG: penicillin-binding transpeptidase domain-containing protein [Gemmatimonadaceae bacterium]|nr:penicillin-binding transpeptidase domain-containing protein [Gemmatimonadaceae bacterium]